MYLPVSSLRIDSHSLVLGVLSGLCLDPVLNVFFLPRPVCGTKPGYMQHYVDHSSYYGAVPLGNVVVSSELSAPS